MEERTSDEDSKEVNSVSTADVILESKYSDMTTQIKFIGLEKQFEEIAQCKKDANILETC